jgi:hypothetical protein
MSKVCRQRKPCSFCPNGFVRRYVLTVCFRLDWSLLSRLDSARHCADVNVCRTCLPLVPRAQPLDAANAKGVYLWHASDRFVSSSQ